MVIEPRRSAGAPLAVACVGGLASDRIVRPLRRLERGTSNPVSSTRSGGGVASNVAESLALLGCPVSLFSAVGEDAEGEHLLARLRARGVDVGGVSISKRAPTASYTAVLDEGGGLVYGLADMELLDGLGLGWAERIAPRLASLPLWLVDANLPGPLLERLLRQRPAGVRALVDPVSAEKALRVAPIVGAVDLLFPDRRELEVLAGMPATSNDEVIAAAGELRRGGAGGVVVSLGEAGLYLDLATGTAFRLPLPAARPADVTGAGDALIAGWLFALATGAEEAAPRYALAAASLAVEARGAVPRRLSAALLGERAASTAP